MKELLEAIAKELVEHPEDVNVTETVAGDQVLLELRVNGSDMGKVMGRQGRIAKASRTVVKAAAMKENKNVSVEIMD